MTPEALEQLVKLRDAINAVLEIEGVSPAASPPEGGCPTRAAGSHPTHCNTSSEAPLPDQAESLASWKYRAEQAEAMLERIEEWNEEAAPTKLDRHYARALELLRNRYEKDQIASLIAHLLRGNGAQSAAREGEGCRCEKPLVEFRAVMHARCCRCSKWLHPEPEQASGSGNGGAEAPGGGMAR